MIFHNTDVLRKIDFNNFDNFTLLMDNIRDSVLNGKKNREMIITTNGGGDYECIIPEIGYGCSNTNILEAILSAVDGIIVGAEYCTGSDKYDSLVLENLINTTLWIT